MARVDPPDGRIQNTGLRLARTAKIGLERLAKKHESDLMALSVVGGGPTTVAPRIAFVGLLARISGAALGAHKTHGGQRVCHFPHNSRHTFEFGRLTAREKSDFRAVSEFVRLTENQPA